MLGPLRSAASPAEASPGEPSPAGSGTATTSGTPSPEAPAPRPAPDPAGMVPTPAGAVDPAAPPAWPALDSPTAPTERITAVAEPTPEEHLLRRLLGDRLLALDATWRARLWGWIGPLLVTLLGGYLRFRELGRPDHLVFDETYYVKQGYTYFTVGYDADWPEEYDESWNAGLLDGFLDKGDYVVHPPVGKWVISLGFHLGDPTDPATWRLTTAILGTLAILVLARTARRLFASTALGTVAGLLFAVDGQALVHARTALLDNTLMFFVLVAFAALVLDREQARRRLARRCAAQLAEHGEVSRWGPGLGVRWWRLLAALALGLAVGTKWSGLYFFAVFAVMSVLWDLAARRRAGVDGWFGGGILKDGVPAALQMIPLVALTYAASWTGWFRNDSSYGRHWAAEHPGEGVLWLPESWRSWWKYHLDMWSFHNTLTSEHSYEAHPLGWPLQIRPTSFAWDELPDPWQTCGWDRCVQAVLDIGNPLVWLGAAVAIPFLVFWGVARGDWRAWAALSGYAAGWLPWLAYSHRTIFTFYSIAFAPWVVLCLTYLLGKIRGAPDAPERRRDAGLFWAGVVLLAILAVSAFFYPIWTAEVVPYRFWQLHMWLPSWV